jgi:hypothetical protein
MGKKLLINESERRTILEMYGLITEDIDKELLDYGNNYIDNNSCDQIYEDMRKFQAAANSGQVQMSDEDKKEMEDDLNQMKTFKGLACGKIKKEMKKSFAEQSQSNPEKLKVAMCWFAANISKPQTPLQACQVPQTDQPKTTVDQPQTDQPKTTVDQPTTQTPVTLDSPEKIKAFQDWMDKNHGKWAYSQRYKRNYSVNGNPKLGYGNLGPNTRKNWETYKNDPTLPDILKSTPKKIEEPVNKKVEDVDDGVDETPKSNIIQTPQSDIVQW